MPDVAFDADSFTGVPVYDSFNNGNSTPWVKVGGTSFATPSWGALVAIADQGRNLAGKPVLDNPTLMSMLYAMPASNFNDITIGSSTGATPQNATAGYDLVTGRGTPKGQLIVGDLVGVGAVSGTVFNDANGNGLNDGDAGLSGWTIYSDLNNNSAFDPVATGTFNSTDVPKAILNLTTITSTTNVPALPGNIIDVNVTINISHNSDNNLKITLISPTGMHIVLADRVGGSGNNFTNTIFDDSAPILIDNGTAPFASTYHPKELLSALYGANPQGIVDVGNQRQYGLHNRHLEFVVLGNHHRRSQHDDRRQWHVHAGQLAPREPQNSRGAASSLPANLTPRRVLYGRRHCRRLRHSARLWQPGTSQCDAHQRFPVGRQATPAVPTPTKSRSSTTATRAIHCSFRSGAQSLARPSRCILMAPRSAVRSPAALRQSSPPTGCWPMF